MLMGKLFALLALIVFLAYLLAMPLVVDWFVVGRPSTYNPRGVVVIVQLCWVAILNIIWFGGLKEKF